MIDNHQNSEQAKKKKDILERSQSLVPLSLLDYGVQDICVCVGSVDLLFLLIIGLFSIVLFLGQIHDSV